MQATAGEQAQVVVIRANAQIDREVEAMRATADQAQRITFWQLLALIPVVVFLVLNFLEWIEDRVELMRRGAHAHDEKEPRL